MKGLMLTVGVLAWLTGVALAAPGDPRTVQGTLEWPATVENARFVVVRTDDGPTVYVTIADARRSAPGDITAGNRISAVGVEGFQPHEVIASRMGPEDSALAAGTDPVAASPRTDTAPAAPTPPAETLWQLRGTVQSISGTSVIVRTRTGDTHTVDVSNLSPAIRGSLRPGDEISLYGQPRNDRRLVATGFVQSEATPPAASPPTGR